ncbi:isochorismatase family protein [Actinoplanes sp. NPDC048791]|uniref:isochorismatase family protein n=1 Tax=Actinoplanes sp. NPDC048791 TaxID=3154623 RepID=UPI003411C6E7
MSIPTIVPYGMPAGDALPVNTVHWQPEPSRAALLIHDMQRYFLGFFPPGQDPVVPLVEHTRQIRDAAARLGIPVFYTAQPGGMSPRDRGLLQDVWGPGMSDDPDGRRVVEEVAPRPEDTVVTKWRYSAFVRSDLDRRLARRGRDQLIICGVYAHVGCLMTACDAFSRDIQPFLVADAVADFSADEHRMALEYAARRCASVLSTRALLDALEHRHAALT